MGKRHDYIFEQPRFQQVGEAVGNLLDAAGLRVRWGERTHNVAPSHSLLFGGDDVVWIHRDYTIKRSRPYVERWLHDLLNATSPMLLHNDQAYRGARLDWLHAVAARQRALSAAHRLAGLKAMMALERAAHG